MDFGWDMGGGDWLGPILVLILVGVVVYFASRTMALRRLKQRPATPPSPRPYVAPVQPAPAPPAAVAPPTLRDRLAQLDEVKREGLITQEEYDTARAGILLGVTQGPPPAP